MLALQKVYLTHHGNEQPAPAAARDMAHATAEGLLPELHPNRPIRLYRAANAHDTPVGSWLYSPPPCADMWTAVYVLVAPPDPSPASPLPRAMAAGLAAVEQALAAPARSAGDPTLLGFASVKLAEIARPSGPDTCPDGQPHRWRPLTGGERIGYGEMASEREMDAARKCGECGAWSDAANVAREAARLPVVDLSALPANRAAIEELFVELDTPAMLDVQPTAYGRGPGRREAQPQPTVLAMPTDVIAEAKVAGFTHVLTHGGPVPLAEWRPYGKAPAANAAVRFHLEGAEIRETPVEAACATVDGQLVTGIWRLISGPVPAGTKRTPCNGARMAGPDTPRVDYWEWARNERGVRDPQAAHEQRQEAERASDRDLRDLVNGRRPAGRTLAALALACLLPLLAAGPAHAVKRPACQPVPDGHGGKVWARPVKGGWSTLSCEPSYTVRATDRVKASAGFEVRPGATPEHCTVWVHPKSFVKVIAQAVDACTDEMADRAGA